MGFRLCPICELNYIIDDNAKMCDICASARSGAIPVDEILCPVCRMHTVNANEDICPSCKREASYDETEREVIFASTDELEDIAIDDSMELPTDSDDTIPESDLEEISKDLTDGDVEEDEEMVDKEGEQGD